MAEVVVLSGGVGGARFVRGLVDLVGPREVTVIGNVGDDAEFFGLHVSPDLDSIVYALADLHDEQRGWGRRRETWNALDTAKALGDPETWFQLGDRDLGLHLVRTKALQRGRAALGGHRADREGVRRRGARAAGDRRPAADDRRDARRRVLAPGVVRRPAAQGQGRRPAVRGRRLREAGAGRARRDRAGVARRDRAEQPVHLGLADPRGRRDPRHDPAEAHAGGRRQPARRRQGGQGPGRRDDEAARRRDDARPTSRAATRGCSTRS